MGVEAKKTHQDLIIESKKSTLDIRSLKKRREKTSKVLLEAQRITYEEKCTRCNLNCRIKHRESLDFWAVKQGLEPTINSENCPKQGKVKKCKK